MVLRDNSYRARLWCYGVLCTELGYAATRFCEWTLAPVGGAERGTPYGLTAAARSTSRRDTATCGTDMSDAVARCAVLMGRMLLQHARY
eukprot:3941996-Rhodomonas_salina.2